jgi:malate synthase
MSAESARSDRVRVGSLSVHKVLYRFVVDEAAPGSGAEIDAFWAGLEAAATELEPRRRALIARRAELQQLIDDYHRATPGVPADPAAYRDFLTEIGYLVEEPPEVHAVTEGVDVEVSSIAGPQLVVPLLNARFATNAANARWGSLYDALYGSDVIPETSGWERGTTYNPARGAEVVARTRAFLDEHFPLEGAGPRTGISHTEVTAYGVDDDGLAATVGDEVARLVDPSQYVGHLGSTSAPTAMLLVHNGLHVEIKVDPTHPVGRDDKAGVCDLVLEAAVTTIMDLEDSVAAVDVDDKVLGYRNWLRLMQGTLSEQVSKGEETFTRTLTADRTYIAPAGSSLTLPGRALLFIRHVGHLMDTDMVLGADGQPISEGLLDAFVTMLGSCHDLRGGGLGPDGRPRLRNSRTQASYVVKPKMHGPDEVRLTCDLFAYVEQALGLPPLTIKLGIMDEERRTSVNLAACLEVARDRVAFINTGFLDRTGDEIRTWMYSGPVVRKAAMKETRWIDAYERSNVDIGILAGLPGRAQIGKGMWAAPDNLAEMLKQKVDHPNAGASTAWVPSPTAATLHAIHYHQVNAFERQRVLADRARASLDDLISAPLGNPADWSAEDRQAELDNNIQGVLGYVSRWVDKGVGCSKVPDISGTQLMEDRATCRISSQHITNWLYHGIVTVEQVEETLRRLAVLVDEQNADDPGWVPLAPACDGEAFLAARELCLEGLSQPNGYTEPILHRRRAIRKAELAAEPDAKAD